jgi:hypothetical protein
MPTFIMMSMKMESSATNERRHHFLCGARKQ